MGIQVSWQPGGGAVPSTTPGAAFEFRLGAGQDTTPPLNFLITTGGWGGNTPGYNQPYQMQAKPNPGAQLVQLFDSFGNPLPDLKIMLGNGQARVKVTGSPGAAFVDVGLMAYEQPPGVFAGGLSNNLRVWLPAPAPVKEHAYEIKNNGVSLGVAMVPEPENVTIYRDGALIWPNYHP